jgi:hypothetical protein
MFRSSQAAKILPESMAVNPARNLLLTLLIALLLNISGPSLLLKPLK